MAIDVVSQYGPNPQSVTKPDRSVSVPSAKETAVSMMGLGGVTNIRLKRLRARRDDLSKQYEALSPPGGPYDQAVEEVLDELDLVEAEINELDPPDDPPSPPMVETWNLDDPAQRKAAIEKWGGRHLGSVPDIPADTMAGAPPSVQALMTHLASKPTKKESPWPTDEESELGLKNIEGLRRQFPKAGQVVPLNDPEPGVEVEADEEQGTLFSSIVSSVQSAMPDIGWQEAAGLAAIVLAGVAGATGVGGPLVPPILAGGALLSSQ